MLHIITREIKPFVDRMLTTVQRTNATRAAHEAGAFSEAEDYTQELETAIDNISFYVLALSGWIDAMNTQALPSLAGDDPGRLVDLLRQTIIQYKSQHMSFGQKLKMLRATMHKNQTEVVQEIGAQFPDLAISQSTLSTLEQREAAPRSEEIVYALARYYGVPAAYLLGTVGGSPEQML